jgi:hypothetical protein
MRVFPQSVLCFLYDTLPESDSDIELSNNLVTMDFATTVQQKLIGQHKIIGLYNSIFQDHAAEEKPFLALQLIRA